MTTLQRRGLGGQNTITRMRYTNTVVYSPNGEALETRATPELENIQCSAQPPNRDGTTRIIQELGGQRITDWILIYCPEGTLRAMGTQDNQLADRFNFNGQIYEVRHINTWRSQSLGHDEAYCIRVDVKEYISG